MAPGAAPFPKGEIRIGFVSEKGLDDLPVLEALDQLAQQGYKITPQFLSSSALVIAALAQGDLDITTSGTLTTWAATSKGANIRTIMERVANVWGVVATDDIKQCSDLAGKRLNVSNLTGINKTMTDAYINANCPGIKYDELYLSNSQNALAALTAGQVDASIMQRANVALLDAQFPGRYRELTRFAVLFPKVRVTGISVNGKFASEHRAAVLDFVRTLLTFHRRFKQDPSSAQSAAIRQLDLDPATLTIQVQAYIDANVWDVNGGMDSKAIQYTLDFYKRTSGLDSNLTAAQVTDLSYLNAVLDEIGRK